MTTSTREQRRVAMQKTIQKSYGEHHFVRADQGYVKRPMIPINCLQLDAALGGGFQAGGFHLLWGWESGGKTTTALKAMANSQKMCSACTTFIQPGLLLPPVDGVEEWRAKRWACVHCDAPYHDDDRPLGTLVDWLKSQDESVKGVDKAELMCMECGVHGPPEEMFARLEPKAEWSRIEGAPSCECGRCVPSTSLFVDFEGRLDLEWAVALGVDAERMWLEEPEYGEAGIDIIREAISQGVVDFIVIDSLSNISASAEIDATSEDAVVGTSARLVNRFLRGLPGLLHKSRNTWGVRPTVVGINQVRHKIGGFGGHATFGGEGQKFQSSSTVKFTSSNVETDTVQVGAKSRKEFMGLTKVTTIKATTQKSSVRAVRGLNCEMYLVTADHDGLVKGEFDDYNLTYKWGRNAEVITKLTKSDPGFDPKRPMAVLGWPQMFKNEADLKKEMHRNQYFKMHIHRHIITTVHEDWTVLREKLA